MVQRYDLYDHLPYQGPDSFYAPDIYEGLTPEQAKQLAAIQAVQQQQISGGQQGGFSPVAERQPFRPDPGSPPGQYGQQYGGAIGGTGGAIGGAVLGAPFGPIGMIVGGALGGLVGSIGGQEAGAAITGERDELEAWQKKAFGRSSEKRSRRRDCLPGRPGDSWDGRSDCWGVYAWGRSAKMEHGAGGKPD